MINPEKKIKKIWDILVIFVTIFASIEIPLRYALHIPLTGAVKALDWAVTIIFAVDILFTFFTATYNKGQLSNSKSLAAKKYLKGWFFIDFLATVPFDIIFSAFLPSSFTFLRVLKMVRLLRILRLARLAQLMKEWQNSSIFNPSLLRLAFFMFWILLIAHWSSCGWIALDGVTAKNGPISQYITSYYWCITTLTTVGYGDISPTTDIQKIYTMFVMILGVGVYGYVIGNVSSILSNIDVAKAAHAKKMESVNAFLKYREIPMRLQERIRNYYTYLWESRSGQDESSFINDLPPSLKIDVALHLSRDIIAKVPMFKEASDDFIKELVIQLEPQVVIPGDYVIRRGEMGNNMYFISTGSVDVVSDDGKTVYATLSDGNFFGEMSLLLGQPRTASIRAVTYCDLYSLDKEHFDKVLEKFPDFKEKIKKITEERMKEMGANKRK